MARKIADCRDFPSQAKCTLTIAGEEEEVVRAATLHAVDYHGHTDTPEFRKQVRSALKDERAVR
jgi:predicted small metal-binding protein